MMSCPVSLRTASANGGYTMKNLTLRYSATQFTYWAASSGAASFATTYLLKQELSSGIVGILLASAGLLSCLT